MMEKRNFVTSVRTPMEGASDIDEVIDSGRKAFGLKARPASASRFEKDASCMDEHTDQSS